MRRRDFISLVGGAAAAWPNSAAAQPRAGRALVAMLVSGSSDGYAPFVAAFRRGLQRLGYVEGYDLEIVYRYSDGDPTRMPAFAEELVNLKPECHRDDQYVRCLSGQTGHDDNPYRIYNIDRPDR